MQILDKKLFDEQLPEVAAKHFDKGVSCHCFETADDGMVFKLFRYQSDAQTAYDSQLLASQVGLGPLLYSGILHLNTNLKPYGDIEVWGFYCEKVEIFMDSIPAKRRKEFEADELDLQNKFQAFFGRRWTDSHHGNVGYKMNRQGKRSMVVIDFGHESFGCPDSKTPQHHQLQINWPQMCSAAEQALSDIIGRVT